MLIIRLAAKLPRRWRPLSSNVRAHNLSRWVKILVVVVAVAFGVVGVVAILAGTWPTGLVLLSLAAIVGLIGQLGSFSQSLTDSGTKPASLWDAFVRLEEQNPGRGLRRLRNLIFAGLAVVVAYRAWEAFSK